MEKEVKYQFFIGYNDSQTKEQFVSEAELTDLISAYFTKKNIGFSCTHGKGGYMYKEGHYILEHTIFITIIGKQNLDIEKLARGLSMFMNQECIMITKTTIEQEYQ